MEHDHLAQFHEKRGTEMLLVVACLPLHGASISTLFDKYVSETP
jgi:hypothetical protein